MLNGLNDKQKEAVLNTEGAILILAGAGSGKTKVITTKIAYLIKEKNIFPGNVLAITFTNKAAKEMKTRVSNMLEGNIDRLWIGTFHSMTLRILRKHIDKLGYSFNFTVYDRSEQKAIIREGLKELNIPKEDYKESSVISFISRAKNNSLGIDDIYKMYSNSIREKNLALLYEYYENRLKSNNALDFDDLLIKAVELLNKYPEILDYYSRKFQYVFVDEYQDTNAIQYQFIKLVSSFHGNLTAVGDADQSIYAFRGADISNILNFEKDFKDARKIFLEQNYRSTTPILNAANEVIKNNTERIDKNLWTARKGGSPVIYRELSDNQAEALFVAQTLNSLYREGYKADDIAVLYRTNAQSRNFEECFMRYEIPYKIVGGLKFYDRKEVKDLISYLKLIVNPKDNIAFMRVINEPKRGIGKTSTDKLENLSKDTGLSFSEIIEDENNLVGFSSNTREKLKSFAKMINELRHDDNLSLKGVVEETLDKSDMLNALKKEGSIEAKARIENLEEFLSVALDFEDKNPEMNLEEFVSNLSLMTDGDKTEEGNSKITLMTIHGAKGLEFPVVFVTGLEEGLFPSKTSIEEDEVEEERRLCYVALTRAKDRLYLTNVNSRTIYGHSNYTIKSRFIDEMGDTIEYEKKNKKVFTPAKVDTHFKGNPIISKKIEEKSDVKFSIGDKVNHKLFGEGMIVQITPKGNDNELAITFEGKGIKRLLQSLARLEKI